MSTRSEGRWVYASCGTRHETNEKPCRNCASEQFARLEEPDTFQIESTGSVTWICKNCGRPSPRNDTQCNSCGSFQYRRAAGQDGASAQPSDSEEEQEKRSVTVAVLAAYGFALINLLAAASAFALYGLFVAGSCWTLSAVIAMPISRSRIEDALNIELSTGATLVLIAGFYMAGNLLAAPHI